MENSAPQPLDIVTIRRLMLLWLQTHFSREEHYGRYRDRLCGLVYDPVNPAASKLLVQLSDTSQPAGENTRPALYVHFGGFVFEKLVVGNNDGLSADGSRAHFITKATGELSLIGIYKSADIASMLTECAFDFLQGLQDVVRQSLRLKEFDAVHLIQKEKRTEKPDETYKFEAKFRLRFDMKHDQIFESHLLKKVALYAQMAPRKG